MTAGFIALLLAGSLALSGCSSNNDDNNGCCYSNSPFSPSHLSGVANADDGIGGTNDGASNASIALTLPGLGEIPGTEDIHRDVGEVLAGFGGGSLVDALDAIRSGDFRALLDALDGPRFGWEDFDRPVGDHDFQDVVVGLDLLKDRLHSR